MLRKSRPFIALFAAVSMIFLSGVIPTAIFFKAASDEHVHSEECYSVSYEFGELICGKEEHTHTDDCFEDEVVTEVVTDDSEQGWHYEETITKALEASCGKEYHIHDESCYEQIEAKTLICEEEETEVLTEYNFHVRFLCPNEETESYVAVENGAYDFTTKIKSDGTFTDGAFESPSVDGYFWYDMHILRDNVSDSGQLKFEGINKKTYDLGDNMTWTANHQARVYAYQPTDGEINSDIVLELLYAPLPEVEPVIPKEEEEISPSDNNEEEIIPPSEEEEEEEVVPPEEEEEKELNILAYTLTVRYWYDNEQLAEPTVVNLQNSGFIEGFAIEDGHMNNAITTKIFKDYILYNTVVSKYQDKIPSRKNINLNEEGLSDNFVYITGVSGDNDFEVSNHYVIDVYYIKKQDNNQSAVIPTNPSDITPEPPVTTPDASIINPTVTPISVPNVPVVPTIMPIVQDLVIPDQQPIAPIISTDENVEIVPDVVPNPTPSPIEQLENLNIDITDDIIINAEEEVIVPGPIPIENTVEQIYTIVDTENELSANLTSIEEVETALANIALDNHVCNILSFIILLSITVTIILYFRSAKAHQEKIFELRRLLGEDDPCIREFT